MMNDKALRNMAEERGYKAGGGAWHHKKTGEWIQVFVQFYPKLRLYIKTEDGERTVTKEEIEKDYQRLKLE